MTEEEWLRCDSVRTMVEFLRHRQNVARTNVGKRRLRLFACACMRRVEHLMDVPIMHDVIDLAERYAEGKAERHEVQSCASTVLGYWRAPWFRPGLHPLLANALHAAMEMS